LQRRLNEREKEMEADERDRMKEREELEEIRKRLMEEGHPDPEAEMERVCVSICCFSTQKCAALEMS
jgi:RNA-binding protein 25